MRQRSVSASRQVWSGAQKWFTGIVTTVAAVMTLMLNAKSLGLSPWLGLLDPSFVDHATRRIVLTPRVDTLYAIGDTASIVATVTDARGGTLAGASLVWASGDSTIATVDSTGAIVARAPGRTTIEVHVREVVAIASVLVRPLPVALRILGDSAVRLGDGDSTHLAAMPVDARGHAIRGTDVSWSVADTSVVRLDSQGRAVALRPGRTVATVAAGELRALVPLEVVLTPAMIALVDSAVPRALAGRSLARPVAVQVLTRAGQPVPGTPVAFTTENGEGFLNPANATTDAQGRARVQWILGPRAGYQRLLARVASVDSVAVLVAEADPAPNNAKVEIITSELRGVAGTLIEHPARVRVTDSAGVPLSDVRLSWAALDGGRIEGASRTDSAGYAEARWTLGRRAGWQGALVQVGNAKFTPTARMRAGAESGAPHAVVAIEGDRQSAAAGKVLAKPVTIIVRDSLGNPVAGVPVRIAVSAGELADSLPTSGEDGRVALRWTLGTKVGAHRLVASLAKGAPADTVVATARAGAPVAVALTAAKGTGRAQRLTASVTDEHGNAVRNASLVFKAATGKLSRPRAVSDSLGRAVVTWTPAAVATTPAKALAKGPSAPAPAKVSVTVAGTRTGSELLLP